MKAAILVKNKSDLQLKDIELPKKLSFGQVLVKVKYSGICGAQINEIDGVKGKDKYLPHLLGHEGTGIVEKIGEGVKNVSVGDHVVMHWRQNNGIQCEVPKYMLKGKTINAGWVTTFNEKAICSENRLTRIPKSFNLKTATLFGCSLTTAFGVVNNDAKIKIGQSVIIIGVGGVGLNIAQACSLVSANPIIGLDLHKNKLKLGKKFGLTHALMNDSDIKSKIKKILNNKLADVVIETTGISKLIETAYELTNDEGKTILVGVPKNKIKIYSLPLHFNKILKGSHGGGTIPNIDINNYISLFNSRNIKLDKLITHEFSLNNINKAIKLFRTGKAGRIIINMNKTK